MIAVIFMIDGRLHFGKTMIIMAIMVFFIRFFEIANKLLGSS